MCLQQALFVDASLAIFVLPAVGCCLPALRSTWFLFLSAPLWHAGDFVCAREPQSGQWVCRCPEGFLPAVTSAPGAPPQCVDFNECIHGYPQRGLNPCTDPLRQDSCDP